MTETVDSGPAGPPPPSEPFTRQEPIRPDDPDGFGRTGEPGERAEIGRPYVRPSRLVVLVGLLAALGLTRGVGVLLIIGAFLAIIFLHELGHFVMARRAGMKVTEFMIGFGPRIFSFRRGEVEYGLKAIPAGAYVKIIGMANIEEVPPSDESRTYRQKGYWARMGVAVAGSTMHFILALVLIFSSFVFFGRISEDRWVVDTVASGSAAGAAGVELGDRIVSIDGTPTTTFDDMAEIARNHPGATVPVVVERDGRRQELTATISSRFSVYGTIGEGFDLYSNVDGGVSTSAPRAGELYDQGLRDGDVVTEIGGTAVSTIADARRALSARAVTSTGNVTLSVVHEGDSTPSVVRLDIGTELGIDGTRGFFGVGPESVPERLGPVEAIPASVGWFGDVMSKSLVGMSQFFNPSNLAGFASRVLTTAPGETRDVGLPAKDQTVAQQNQQIEGKRVMSIVGAVLFGEDITSAGWGPLLVFLAVFNVGIGLLNLIPLPPFDGGHVALGTYERIRELLRRDGRRYFADYNKVMPVAIGVVSFMAVVGLMAIYLDLADPIRL